MENPSADLVMRWREGDQGAAGEIFGRYAERLLALARSRLSAKLSRHIDPEDVVQSACRSFFVGARDGRYVLKRSGDLWRLLVAITVHKLQHQLERRTAGKRALARESSQDDGRNRTMAETVAREPTPAEATALADMVENLLRPLEPLERQIVTLRLDGYSLEEIAQQIRRSERTVRRVLEQCKESLQKECEVP
jgi:RNA polymerase sigma factor (sigma-70 family)